jgi:hypothetical protein
MPHSVLVVEDDERLAASCVGAARGAAGRAVARDGSLAVAVGGAPVGRCAPRHQCGRAPRAAAAPAPRPLLNVAFIASGACYAVLARRALYGHRWRLPAAVLVMGTLVGYAASIVGGEEPDQVGIATALVELTAMGLAVVPLPARDGPRRIARVAGSGTTVTAAVLVGGVVWVGRSRDIRAAAIRPAP